MPPFCGPPATSVSQTLKEPVGLFSSQPLLKPFSHTHALWQIFSHTQASGHSKACTLVCASIRFNNCAHTFTQPHFRPLVEHRKKKPLFIPECTSVLQFVDQVPQRTEGKRDINYSISNTNPTSRYQPVWECVHVQPHSCCSKWRPSRMSRMRCPFRLAPPSDSSTTCMPFQTSHLPPITITTLFASTLRPCHPLLLPRFGNSVFSSVDCKSQLWCVP